MTKFDLAEASQRMTKAINEMTKVAVLLQTEEKYFDSTVKEIKAQIGDMSVAVELINSELREVI